MTQQTNLATAPLRAVAYARFSSDMQRGESIDAQLRAIQKYAKENNFMVIGEYIDMAKSGKNDDRPEFQNMICDSKLDQFDVIIVHKLDRFARNRYDSVRYRHELKRKDIKLLSVLENYDSETPEGVLIESLYEGMNEYYIRNLSREIMKGLTENAYKAKFNGGIPPLGYDVDEEQNYVINENEAETVRLIFEMSAKGDGYGELIKELKAQGRKTKRGAVFGKNSLHGILNNEKYIGVYEFNVTPKRDVNGRRNNHGRKDESEIVRIENAIPAIVSVELFEKVRKIRQERKHRGGSYTAKEVYLLSGKIFCGKCGSAYTGHRKFNNMKKKYVVYSCGKNQRTNECSSKYIRREYIEGFVLEQIADHVFDENQIPRICKLYKEYLLGMNHEAVLQKQSYEKRLKELTRQINNLLGLAADTGSKSLLDKLGELEQSKAEMEFRIQTFEAENDVQSVSEEEIKKWFHSARKLFIERSLSTSKRLIDLFVDKVTVFENHVELVIKIKPDLSNPTKDKNKSSSTLVEGHESVPSDGAEGGI